MNLLVFGFGAALCLVSAFATRNAVRLLIVAIGLVLIAAAVFYL